MMDFEIKHKKDELLQCLSTLEDKTMIDKILELKKREKKDWWHSISEAEKESIEKGIADAVQGKLKPHSQIHQYLNQYKRVYAK